MDMQNVIYTHSGTAALKRKGLLTHAAIRINLEDMMVSKVNQSKSDKHRKISFI
jgi:hypothetical protein